MVWSNLNIETGQENKENYVRLSVWCLFQKFAKFHFTSQLSVHRNYSKLNEAKGRRKLKVEGGELNSVAYQVELELVDMVGDVVVMILQHLIRVTLNTASRISPWTKTEKM